MENIENKIQNNDMANEIGQLKDLINSQNDEIEYLNNKLNDFKRLLFNQLNDIKEIADSNDSLKKENEELENKFNESIVGELDSLKKENEELENKFNESIVSGLDSLKKENVELENKFKKQNKNYQKILDSYNENFKFIFYFYDLKPKPILKNIQDVCQEVLDFVVNVCEKYGIEYWLEAGTLLGAVRHGGFLPWDDDIDLGMMRQDYNRFQEAFNLEIKNHNIQNKLKLKLLRHGDNVLYFMQISYAEFAILDIFPFDYIANPLENIEELYFSEKSNFKSNIKNGKTYSQAIDEVHKNLNISIDKQDYVIPGVERPIKGRFYIQNTDEMFPLSKITFNGKEYWGFKNNDIHLTKLYGDWRELPKVLERHNRIFKLKERPGFNKNLIEKISDLREINNTF